jgi:hypothetical protein
MHAASIQMRAHPHTETRIHEDREPQNGARSQKILFSSDDPGGQGSSHPSTPIPAASALGREPAGFVGNTSSFWVSAETDTRVTNACNGGHIPYVGGLAVVPVAPR